MRLSPFGWVFTPKMPDVTRIQITPEPVVFCRECTFHRVGENEVDAWNRCCLHSINVGDDEYCSWGVLKDGVPKQDFEEVRKRIWMEVTKSADD